MEAYGTVTWPNISRTVLSQNNIAWNRKIFASAIIKCVAMNRKRTNILVKDIRSFDDLQLGFYIPVSVIFFDLDRSWMKRMNNLTIKSHSNHDTNSGELRRCPSTP